VTGTVVWCCSLLYLVLRTFVHKSTRPPRCNGLPFNCEGLNYQKFQPTLGRDPNTPCREGVFTTQLPGTLRYSYSEAK